MPKLPSVTKLIFTQQEIHSFSLNLDDCPWFTRARKRDGNPVITLLTGCPWKAWWQPRAWFCTRRAQLAAVTKDYCCNNKLLTQTGGNPRTRKSTCFDKRLRSSVRQPFMCYAASSSSGDPRHLLKQTADVTRPRGSQWHHGAVILFQLSPHVFKVCVDPQR